jgi:hypothetical protein
MYTGCEAAQKYMESHRWEILDKHPIIGPYNVNYEGASNDIDKYIQGAWMLLTFRNVLNNDSLFFQVIKNIQSHFALKNVTTGELISYINQLTVPTTCHSSPSIFIMQLRPCFNTGQGKKEKIRARIPVVY